MKRVYHIESEQDTAYFAKSIAPHLKRGDVLALYGDLGTGKTFFTQQLGLELGVKEVINSPTFVLVNIYQATECKLFHLDLYRLKDSDEVWALGIQEMFEEGIVVIEWPELAEPFLPENTNVLSFSFDGKKRTIIMEFPDHNLTISEALQSVNQQQTLHKYGV